MEKPDARIFALALERLEAVAAESLYVGDIFSIDIEGANGAGLSAILLDPLDRYAASCQRVRCLRDLLALLPQPRAGASHSG